MRLQCLFILIYSSLVMCCNKKIVQTHKKCDKTLAYSYETFTNSIVGRPKWTVLELYTDSTFMFAGDLSNSRGNELFCLKGFYRKDTNVIKLRETYRRLSNDLLGGFVKDEQYFNQFEKFGANSQFRYFEEIYLFAPIDSLGVLNLYLDDKKGYKINQISDAIPAKIDSGYVKVTTGDLPRVPTSKKSFFLEPVKLEKSIFNCECPTENLFSIYEKLFPKDAKARQRIGTISRPTPKN